MKLLYLFIALLVIQPSFRTEQKAHARVKAAYQEKYAGLKKELEALGIKENQLNMLVVVYKSEQKLEVWTRSKTADSFSLFKTYPICASSGELGPKRKGGDGQVPEGFYHIDRFNPYSNFHLSLGVNYPNASDRILGYKNHLGGDIFIHGSCVTIGCMPLTDDLIKEVYILAVEAKASGQGKIHCMIFPNRMTDEGMKTLKSKAGDDKGLWAFWQDIREGYLYFEKNKKVPKWSVANDGSYTFSQ